MFSIKRLITVCLTVVLVANCKDTPSSEPVSPPTAEGQTNTTAQSDSVKSAAILTSDTIASPATNRTVSQEKSDERVDERSTEIKKETPKPKKKQRKRAKISFDETVHKFGTIKSGDKIKHTFQFKNTGNAPLTIKNVDVSCGCTFPSYPFIPIEPGENGEIEVTFNSENKVGRQKPTVTVVTNGRPRTVKLYMEGFVE